MPAGHHATVGAVLVAGRIHNIPMPPALCAFFSAVGVAVTGIILGLGAIYLIGKILWRR